MDSSCKVKKLFMGTFCDVEHQRLETNRSNNPALENKYFFYYSVQKKTYDMHVTHIQT